MGKGDPGTVQRLPGEFLHGAAVEFISQQRPAFFSHMHPNLMGAAGVQNKTHQGAAFIRCGGKDFILGYGAFPIGGNHTLHFQRDLPFQRQVDETFGGLRNTTYYGNITLGNGFPQLACGNLMAGDYYGASGVLIDAVYRPEGAAAALFFAQGGIYAGQRAEDVPARLMHRHTGRFIENGDIPVPVEAGNIDFAGR